MPPPSLRYTTVSVRGDARNGRTVLILGRNTRHEYRNATGHCAGGDPTIPGAIQYRYGPARAVIENHDFHYSFHLDFEAEVYTRTRLIDPWALARHEPVRRAAPQPGLPLRVHTKTIDTGERRQMFGYQARRIIVRTTKTLEGHGQIGVTETEGWYIDPPPAWGALHPPTTRAILLASIDGQMPTPVFSEDGLRETGFPLVTTSTHSSRYRGSDGTIHQGTFTDCEEVTEISEAALDPDLFAPPRHFRQVERLPGERPMPSPMRLRHGWQRIKRALRLPI